uniref:Methyltransferase domain-containing protein n=1 Tax=Desulfobacca acetoxidans TaxID=60893 RepID=A0A7V4GA78_9BACT
MHQALLDLLICPRCLPGEQPLKATLAAVEGEDILEGMLGCAHCGTHYPIQEGIAFLDPHPREGGTGDNRYETPAVVSSYLWSHYGDLWQDEFATDAYRRWAALMEPMRGLCLDTGSAVGRFTFEMAKKFDSVIGVDNSVAFIRTSRELRRKRGRQLALREEGTLTRTEALVFPEDWPTHNTEFIVGDAQALPFRAGAFAGVSSLNVVDKVPQPLTHLRELNRVAAGRGAQLLFSDPFSWSEEAAEEKEWLGGQRSGPFSGRALDHIQDLLKGQGDHLLPPWSIEKSGQVWWTIRTHANHYERIQSCLIKARR